MGCLFSTEKDIKQEALKTEAIYSLIFKDAYINENDRSLSDSQISYKCNSSPESDLR